MSLTHCELLEKLKKLDEITLLEILEVSAEDIVERFQDFVENKRDNFEEDLEDVE